MVSVLVSHGYRYRYLIGIGTGISWVLQRNRDRYRYFIGIVISIGTSAVSASVLSKKGLWLFTTECGAMCYETHCGVTLNKLIGGFGDAYSPDK